MLRRTLLASVLMAMAAFATAGGQWNPAPPVDNPDPAAVEALRAKLKNYPYKIVYQTVREPKNFELFVMNADGSDQKNLTNTPDRNEYYPQCSFDGKLIAYEADAPSMGPDGKPLMKGDKPVMHSQVWVMNPDGSNQRMVSDYAQQPAWSHDNKTLAFMRDDEKHHCIGLVFHDMATGKDTDHVNKKFSGAMNLSYTLDDQWVTAVVGGTTLDITAPDGKKAPVNVGQSILAAKVGSDEVVDLIHQSRDLPTDPASGQNVMGCRPDVSPDGKRVTWAVEEKFTRMWIAVADLKMVNGQPQSENWKWIATAPMNKKPSWELYHPDWSPDGKFIVFAKGVRGSLMQTARFMPRQVAPTWNICIADPDNPGPYVEITTDGLSDKEPDFLPIAK